MNHFEHLRIDHDQRDIVTVTFDAAYRPVNTFDESLLRELQEVIAAVEADDSIRMVVFRSGKESGFLAGADVHRIQQIETADEARIVLKLGQDLFDRVSRLPMPTIAVIHGPCLGGGLEFALACTYRVARDEASTRIGFPETQLGVIPGWGGTQRLPQVVGLVTAIGMILEGSRLSARKAKKTGLIDATLDPETFDASVAKFINEHLSDISSTPRRHRQLGTRNWLDRLRDNTSLGQKLVFWFARRRIARQVKHYPALGAALRAIETGLMEGMQSGLAKERDEFCDVLFTPTCRNLLELFFQRERARQRQTWVAADQKADRSLKTIAVLGAGTMGAGIAQLAATCGFRVVLKDVNDALVQQGIQRIDQLTQKAVQKGVLSSSDAETALAAITTTTETSPLADADLVIEAIVERLDVKQQVFRELDEHLPMHALVTSNTSALPISEMASVTGRPDRVAGLHFFNPVHKMPLVEIVRCADTSDRTIATLVDVVRQLGKTPLVVAEGPGFLVNRILFPYLDEAVRLVCEGHSVEEIDKDAKRFGMPMGPLELLDTVGLDVAADVSHTLTVLGLEESPTPDTLAAMVEADCKGQKSGKGFYTYNRGRRGKPTTSGKLKIDTPSSMVQPLHQQFGGETLSSIQQRLVFSLINAAADCLHDGIVADPWMVDLGMALGTGFAPFRGGPMRLVETWGRQRVIANLEQLSEQCGPRFRPSEYLKETAVSRTQEGVSV